jgi:hypothetical protein
MVFLGLAWLGFSTRNSWVVTTTALAATPYKILVVDRADISPKVNQLPKASINNESGKH